MKRSCLLIFVVLLAIAPALAQSSFDFKTMLAAKRVGDPQISPDGKTIAFTVGKVSLEDNKTNTQIFTMNIDGSNVKQITDGSASHSSPRWSPDGSRLAIVTGGQIWTIKADGTGKKQVTTISTGAGGPVWSPDGRWIAFSSEVYPECKDDACNRSEDSRVESSKVKAKIADRLLYRHWVEWRDRKRTHVFIVAVDGGAATDLTPGDFDSPPYAAATGTDYAFSPDGKEIAFLRNFDKVEATSTNSDIVVLDLAAKTQKNITEKNRGYDAAPHYTPDGKYIIFRSQETATFEADRWRIMRYDRKTGETVELTQGFDQQADDLVISPDSKTVYFSAGTRGRSPIYSVPVEPDLRLRIATHVKMVAQGIYAGNLGITADGSTLVFTSSSMAAPAEVFSVAASGGEAKKLTAQNGSFGLATAEEMDWKGGDNAPVHGFFLKPANFDASKKYPMIVLIHGGPQGAWSDNWGYRWNPQVFANAGYVVFMPNPRGSTGYGQQFVNEISGDWGGRVVVDIKNGVAEAINRPYVDKDRIGAAGASYGGYMVDWLLGHNDDPRFKFKAFVSHAGVYNLESMAATTEELWFVNWEFKGMPWENRENYEKWSPHRFAANFSTPTLVTAGELDYRVPVDQSLQLFTALQLKNVDSRLIVFPDEGHWILKPQNSELWYTNVIGWFDKHLRAAK